MIGRWTRGNWPRNWQGLAIGILLAGLLWQTLRIEGVQIGPVKLLGKPFYLVDRPGLKPKLATCQGNLADVLLAQAEAEALQAAVNEDEERRTAANAERSDASHAQDQTRAAAAGRDYAFRNRIAAGGVRAQSDGGAPGQTSAAASGGSADLHEDLHTDPIVAVSGPDVQACTAAVTWAVGAFNWAQTLPQHVALPADLPSGAETQTASAAAQ